MQAIRFHCPGASFAARQINITDRITFPLMSITDRQINNTEETLINDIFTVQHMTCVSKDSGQSTAHNKIHIWIPNEILTPPPAQEQQ